MVSVRTLTNDLQCAVACTVMGSNPHQWFTVCCGMHGRGFEPSPTIYSVLWHAWSWVWTLTNDLQCAVACMVMGSNPQQWFTVCCGMYGHGFEPSPMIYSVLWHAWSWVWTLTNDLQCAVACMVVGLNPHQWFTVCCGMYGHGFEPSPMIYSVLWCMVMGSNPHQWFTVCCGMHGRGFEPSPMLVDTWSVNRWIVKVF